MRNFVFSSVKFARKFTHKSCEDRFLISNSLKFICFFFTDIDFNVILWYNKNKVNLTALQREHKILKAHSIGNGCTGMAQRK